MNPLSTTTLDYSHADKTMEDIITIVEGYMHTNRKDEIRNTLWDTYVFAKRAHEGQIRKSGEPYINHPVEAAKILTSIKPDLVTLQACLLHDVPEDTEVDVEMIRESYGDVVANLTAGMEKLSSVRYQGEERTIGSLRKMFFCMTDDIRVIFVKLADRLHNMRTLYHHPDPAKRKKIAFETLNIYAPIADRLGLFGFKSELETECFKALYPEESAYIIRELAALKDSQEQFINGVEGMIREAIGPNIIVYDISYRVKSPYSIFKKLERKEISKVVDLYDLFAVRVITDSVRHCYEILGYLHGRWKPLPKRFKDYIALPKENGYQSLHTTVVGLLAADRTQPTEIQIRTKEMHEHAEIGVAAHFEYSEQGGSVISNDVSWVKMIKGILDKGDDNSTFFQELKTQIFDDQIFVFTPKGKVITLPRGATAIDFAYHIHSDIGNHLAFVRINGRNASIDQPLSNGDVVEILTDTKRKASSTWIPLAKTSRAREALKSFVSLQNRDELIEKGRHTLSAYLEHTFGRPLDKDNHILDIYDGRELTQKDKEEIFIQIGNGSRKPSSVIRGIELLKSQIRARAQELDTAQKKSTNDEDIIKNFSSENTLIIGGEKGIDYSIAACCHPEPSDRVIGYVTHDGVRIHKHNCEELTHKGNIERFVEAYWSHQGRIEKKTFQLTMYLEGKKVSPIQILEHIESLGLTIESFDQRRCGEVYKIALHLSSQIDDFYLEDRLKQRLLLIPGVRFEETP